MLSRFRASALLVAVVALIAALLAILPSTTAQAVGEDSGGVYVPLTPAKIVNTSTGLGSPATPIAANSSRSFTVLGAGGVPSTDVGAVILDIGGTSSADSNLYAYGTTKKSPFLQLDATMPRSNTVVVEPDPYGKVTVFNSAGNANITIDVQGYFTATSDDASPGGFVVIPAKRVVDTNAGIGLPLAKIGTGTYTAQVGGVGDIPSDATSVWANVRVMRTTVNGELTVGASDATFDSDTPVSVNFAADTTTDSGMSIKLGADGKLKLKLATTTTVDVIIDVQGYFIADPNVGGSFTPLPNEKIYDTHDTTALAASATAARVIKPAGVAGIPDDGSVAAVMVTLTVSDWQSTQSATQYVKVYNPDTGAPGTTNIGFRLAYAGVPVSTTAIVPLSTLGKIALQNLSDAPLHVGVSVQGYFTGVTEFVDLGGASTIYDTAEDEGNQALAASEGREIQVTGMADVPLGGVQDVKIRVTTKNPTVSGSLRVRPSSTVSTPSQTFAYSGAYSSTSPWWTVPTRGITAYVENLGTEPVDIMIEVSGYTRIVGSPMADSELVTIVEFDDGTSAETDEAGTTTAYDAAGQEIAGDTTPADEINDLDLADASTLETPPSPLPEPASSEVELDEVPFDGPPMVSIEGDTIRPATGVFTTMQDTPGGYKLYGSNTRNKYTYFSQNVAIALARKVNGRVVETYGKYSAQMTEQLNGGDSRYWYVGVKVHRSSDVAYSASWEYWCGINKFLADDVTCNTPEPSIDGLKRPRFAAAPMRVAALG